MTATHEMIEQRPYVNEKSSYLYGLYDSNLQQISKDSTALKLNIERSLLEFSSSDSKLLTIDEFEKLVELQKRLASQKKFVVEELSINNEILQKLRHGSHSEAVVEKSLKFLEILNSKLLSIDKELTQVTTELQSHYFKIASLSSVQDLVASTADFDKTKYLISTSNYDDSTSFKFVGFSYLDEMVSHIASVAAQRNITLPVPTSSDHDTASSESKLSWVKSCIDSILLLPTTVAENNMSASTPITTSRKLAGSFQSSSPSMADSKEIINLKTALKDLQFAHQYLTKQYEEERSVNSQAMNSLRLKLQNSQELLLKTNKELSKQTQNLINLELQLNTAELNLSAKNDEIAKLTKKINLLQIDHLGEQTLSPPSSSKADDDDDDDDPSHQQQYGTPLSPVTGVGFQNNNSRPNSNSDLQNNSISSSILRLEFKKLLNDINAKHESELKTEQNERKKLENLIKMMKKENSEFSLGTTTQ